MKVWTVISSGFGKQQFLADNVDGALDAFKDHVARCERANKQEPGSTPSTDTVITTVRCIGRVANYDK